jgi:DNA segregation ATPase FtsK/SpoIIIE-like protein
LLNSLIRRGRKANIILVLASHDPTLKNTKANVNQIVPRIAFQVTKHQNSSTALGVVGADKLPGGGAMLFKSQAGIKNLQGSFVTPTEIERILLSAPLVYDDSKKLKIPEPQITADGLFHSVNPTIQKGNKELTDIIIWVLGQENISNLQIQKQFRIGNRAAEIVERLFKLGIVGEKFAKQPRAVIPETVEAVPDEVVAFLMTSGISTDEVGTVIAGRKNNQ